MTLIILLHSCLDMAKDRGGVHLWENLWKQIELANFGVLSSKIVSTQALSGTFSLIFMILMSRFGESEQRAILKQKAGEIFVNKDAVCYFVFLNERTDAMLLFGVVSSLVFMTQ